MKLLLRSVPELRQYVAFSGDLDYDTLVPGLASAQTFLSRYVGETLIPDLAEIDNPTDDQRALLPYLCRPVANLALLKFVNAGNVRITDLGVMRTKTADSGDAFEWQLERVLTTLRSEAYEGLEALLRYLAGKLAEFPSYATSSAYLALSGRLIPSAEIFSHYYDIGGSLLVLQTLQASMRTCETSLRTLLGSNLAGLLGSELDERQQEQLDAARRALVYLTIARALREKLVTISDTGVQVCGISNLTLNYKQPASPQQLQTSMLYFDKEAAGFVADLATLLKPAPDPNLVVIPQPRVMGTAIVSF